MKFTQQELEGVNCRGQKEFSPGGTHGGDFKLLSKTGRFDNQRKFQYNKLNKG